MIAKQIAYKSNLSSGMAFPVKSKRMLFAPLLKHKAIKNKMTLDKDYTLLPEEMNQLLTSFSLTSGIDPSALDVPSRCKILKDMATLSHLVINLNHKIRTGILQEEYRIG